MQGGAHEEACMCFPFSAEFAPRGLQAAPRRTARRRHGQFKSANGNWGAWAIAVTLREKTLAANAVVLMV